MTVVDPGTKLEEDELLKELAKIRRRRRYLWQPSQSAHYANIEKEELRCLDCLSLHGCRIRFEIESKERISQDLEPLLYRLPWYLGVITHI